MRQKHGFTLIELIVVISLISLMLFFSIPRFRNTLLTDPTKKTTRWIIGTVRILKENALRDGKRYILHANLDNNSMWVSDESMSEEALLEASQNGFKLPDGIRLLDVEYPKNRKISISRADIYFYPQGYSDKAMIHMERDGTDAVSFLIEPFLSEVNRFERYASFED